MLRPDHGRRAKSNSINPNPPEILPACKEQPFPHYDTYRLRLPSKAMSAIEQIVICKLMLYSYIYHHPKVRAAEGALSRMLDRAIKIWRSGGETDSQIFERFLNMTDSSLSNPAFMEASDSIIAQYSYRIFNRVIPREVYALSGAIVSHAEKQL
jgi:HD superfamily phosphohydrolase